jgi:hypothetical protein
MDEQDRVQGEPGTEGSKVDLKAREGALIEMGKALRAISIYPAQHPQRVHLLGLAFAHLQAALQTMGELSLKVSKTGFFLNETRVAEKQPAVTELAQEMHLRQIKSFSLRRELTPADFTGLLELLLEAPENFRSGRYIEKWCLARGIHGLWINEMNFSKVMTIAGGEGAGEEGGEEGEGKEAPAGMAGRLDEVLDALERERDSDRFGQLLRELEVLARPLAEAKDYARLWAITASISEHGTAARRPAPAEEAIRALSVRSVRALVKDDFLAHLLERYQKADADQAALGQVFSQVGPPVIDGIIAVMSQRESIGVYRPLMGLAQEFGAAARPVLDSYFRDQDLLKVRRALLLTGELKLRESVDAVRKLLDHQDPKVRREAVRALAMVRGLEASRALIAALHNERDPELVVFIVAALGESKDLAAVPALVKLLKGTALREDTVPLLETVIEALGRIGSMEALPALKKALDTTSFFKKEAVTRVRLKAVTALGRLGGESAMKALARYARPGDDPVRQACTAGLKALLDSNGKPVEPREQVR